MTIFIGFLVIFPGDHPMQFFSRQIVYSHTYDKNPDPPTAQGALSSNPTTVMENSKPNNSLITSADHESYARKAKTLTQISDRLPVLRTLSHGTLQSFIAFTGGLHIQLNAQRDIMGNYHKFLRFIYENLFTNCILAMKPKPWRTSNLFEIVYGGWTLIRTSVITKFAKNKSIEYGILLTLLDTYIPLSIAIYSVIFKSNNFNEFKKTMTRI